MNIKLKTQHRKNNKDGTEFVELKFETDDGTAIMVYVAKDGWDKSQYECRGAKWNDTSGKNVRISMNGAAILTMKEWEYINGQIVKWYNKAV